MPSAAISQMLWCEPPDCRIENRMCVPSNDTAGSETLAPVKFVIGVTMPSGEMGESFTRLPSASERLSVSVAFVRTNTRASVVDSCWMRSSGALSRQPLARSGSSATPRPSAMRVDQRRMQ